MRNNSETMQPFDGSVSKALAAGSPYALPPDAIIGDDGRVHLPPLRFEADLGGSGFTPVGQP